MVLSTSSPISGDATELSVFSDVGSKIILPSASLLFKGDYERDGPDLLVSMDGEQTVRVVDYFTHADAPALYATDGTSLKGSIVESLAGPLAPGQYAQSGASAGADAIGQVEELSGSATVQRADGTTETLQIGTKVFPNDVVQTADGSKVSLTFIDGTIFTLASASRMILDELIYDPNGSENSGIFNLVEGSFVFIAGQAAKTGGLEINTPAATMGIRGTTVRVDIVTVDGKTTVEVSLNRDPDGETGIFTLTDLDGNEIATIDSIESKWIISPVEGETREVDRTTTDIVSDQVLITDAVNAFQSATQRVQQGGNFVENNSPTEQQDGNEGEQDAAPEESGQDAAPDSTNPSDAQQENGAEEQDQSQLDSSGIETDLADFEGGDQESSVAIPELANTNAEAGDSNSETDGSNQVTALQEGDQEIETIVDQETAAEDNVETGDLPTDTTDVVDNGLSIDLPTLTTSVAEDGSIGISGFSIVGPDGGVAIVTLVAGSTVTLAPNSGVTILVGSGVDDGTVQIEGTFDQLNAALNGDGTGPSLIYTPSPNEDDFGTLDITVEFDGESVSSQLVIDITPQQDAPTAVDDTLNIGENGTLAVGNLLDNDSDPDVSPTPDVLTVVEAFADGSLVPFGVATALSFGGAFVVNANGSYSFDPGTDFDDLAAGVTATETISYQITDGNGNFDEAVLTITVTGADDAPSITTANFAAVTEGDTATVTIVAFPPSSVLTASDPDAGETPAVVNGSLSLAVAAGSDIATTADFTVNATDVEVDTSAFDSLAAGQQGLFELSFEVASGSVTSTQTTLITINGENDAPIAAGLTLPTGEGTPVTGQLVASDVDTGDTLTFTAAGAPANGAVIVNADGSFTYTPNADFNGTDSFDFIVDDGNGGTASETVTVTVNAVNDVPVASGQAVTTNEDVAATGQLVASDIDGDTLAFSADGTPANGAVIVNADGSFTYTPNADFNGTDSFDFIVDDGNGGTATETVTVTVNAVNDVPVASGQAVTTNEDVAATGQLVASDIDGDTLTFSADGTPANGSVIVNADGSFTYTPNADFNGTDSFDFIVDDGNGGTASETVTVTANAVNDVPVASGQAVTTNEDVAATGQLVASDVDGDTLTFSADGTPANGSVIVNADGSFTYTPNADFNGTDSFDFIVDDGNGGTASETVTVTVNAVNDVPVASGQAVTTNEDVAATGQLVASDIDGDTLTFSADGTPANGAVIVNADGSFTYTPNADFNGTDSFDFIVDDGNGGTAMETVTVTVDAVNDAPTAANVPNLLSATEDTAINVDLSGTTFADADGDTITVTLGLSQSTFAAPGSGAVAGVTVTQVSPVSITVIGLTADINTYFDTVSNIQYVPPSNSSGNDFDQLTITVDDGVAAPQLVGTLDVDIAAVNDDPTAASIPTDINVVEGVESQIDLSGITFNDIDSADIIVSLVVNSGQFTTVQPGSVIGPDLSVNLSMANFQVISLSGSAADINAYLNDPANITFTGQIGITGNDAATISIFANDGDGSGAVSLGTVNLDIAAPNASPTIVNVPSDITIQEDTLDTLNLSTIEFGDLDGDTLTLTLTVDNGTFAAPGAAGAMSGVTVTQDSATSITIVGQAADIETYLDTVTNIQYQGALNANGNDAAELTLNVSDGISTATSNTINIDLSAVNDAPTATSVPTDISVSVNTASNVDLSNVVLADVDGDQLTVTLSVDIGEFATPAMGGSVTVTQIDAETITLVGSAADINTYLDTASNIQFIGPVDVTGEDAAELSIDVDDGTVNVPAGPVNIDIQGVNAAPSFNLDGLTASELVTNGDFENLDAGFVNGANLVSPGDGTIPGFTVINAPSRVLVGTNLGGGSGNAAIGLGGNPTGGSASTIQTTIETIVGRTYEISLNTSDPATVTGNVAFAFVDTAAGENVTLSNSGNPETFRFVADSTTTVVSIQAQFSTGNGLIVDNLSVTEVRPDNTFVAQEGASTSLEGIVVEDVDSAGSANFSVTLTVTSGTLSDTNGSSPVTITGSGTNTLVLTGTLADINSEIAGGFVTYDGAAGFRGLDTLTITANDGDAAGVGGAQSFTQTVDVVVGNTGSIIVGTNQADNNVGTGQDDIIFSLDSTNGTDVGNFLNGNDVYIGGAGQEDVDGQAGDDFIFGAGGNDVLDGFTGNDTLSGGDGDDTLIDLAGEAGIYDGGDGQDTFSVSNAGTIDLTAIENSAFTSIETLNVFNGEVNVLTLDETDIFDLSETSNAQLETILGASLPQSILIVAEAGDTVNLQLNDPILANYRLGTPTGGFTIVEVTDGEGSTVLATIGISDAATVVVEGLNNAPVVTTSMITTAFNEGDPAVVVNNTIEVSDADGDMITGATVSITLQSGVFETGDVLNFTDTGSITGSYDEATGVLTLTGTDTAANYQAALRSITFESAREDLNDLLRDVDFVVNDGTVDSAAVTSVVNPTSANDAPTIDTSGVVGVETLANGSFETPVIGSGSTTVPFGLTIDTEFIVGDGANAATGTGNVDIVDTGFINAADGNQAIDLDGDTAGAITTTLTTEIGATYEVSFQFAGNPGGDNGVRSANVIVGNQTQAISFDTSGFTFTNLVYQTQTIVFTATATTTELTFESLSADGSDEGILIDDVSVREVASTGVGVGLLGSFTFSDLVFTDPDGDPTNATVTLAVTNGTLTLGAGSTAGLTVGGDGTGTLTLNGALSTINSFFESDDALTYANTSGANGDVDNLSITVNDGGSFGQGVAQSATTSIPISLGSNTIVGTAANNTLSGGSGADVIDGLAGNDTISGGDGNDILFGGDGDDILNGGDGDDLLDAGAGVDSLFGDAGNDTLQSINAFGIDTILDGGAGDDSIFVDDFATLQIEGGTGRDELRYFQSGNIDLRSTGILIDGVEALNIENGETNTLFLDLARLQGLSTDSDTDLEALLDQALTAGRTILGDAGDTVNVEVDAGFTFTQNTALSTDLQDENGNQLDVFEFVETGTGDILATVAIEEQVTVVTS